MGEKTRQTGRALVLRDAQGELSWTEIGSRDNEASSIIAAREKQSFTVHETTTVERAKRIVDPPVASVDDFSQFRR